MGGGRSLGRQTVDGTIQRARLYIHGLATKATEYVPISISEWYKACGGQC